MLTTNPGLNSLQQLKGNFFFSNDLTKQTLSPLTPLHTGAREKQPTCSMDQKGVSATQRAKEFAGV